MRLAILLLILQFSCMCVVRAENSVVVGDDGKSALVISGAEPVVMFHRTLSVPMSGGAFRRPQVWAGQQELRITTLDGSCLVFLGKLRVGTVPFGVRKAGEALFCYRENGFTLKITVLDIIGGDEESARNRVAKLDVVITRP
jgi:hypothetical protein